MKNKIIRMKKTIIPFILTFLLLSSVVLSLTWDDIMPLFFAKSQPSLKCENNQITVGQKNKCYLMNCDKGQWIITNKQGFPLDHPLVEGMSFIENEIEFTPKNQGKILVKGICFDPLVVEEEIIEINERLSYVVAEETTTTIPECGPESCQTLLNLATPLWRKTCNDSDYNSTADINKDKIINVVDFMLISAHCGNEEWCQEKLNNPLDPCTTPPCNIESCQKLINDSITPLLGKNCSDSEYNPRADIDKDRDIDYTDIQTILEHCNDEWCQEKLDNPLNPCSFDCSECVAENVCHCNLTETCDLWTWTLSNKQGNPLKDILTYKIPPNTTFFIPTNTGKISVVAACSSPEDAIGIYKTEVEVKPRLLNCPKKCAVDEDCECEVIGCNDGLFIATNKSGEPISTITGDITTDPYSKSFKPESTGKVQVEAYCERPLPSKYDQAIINVIEEKIKITTSECDENNCTINIDENIITENVSVFIQLIEEPEGIIYYSSSFRIEPEFKGEKTTELESEIACPVGTRLKVLALVYKESDLDKRIGRFKEHSFVC